MAVLRGVTAQMDGDFYCFGSSKYHREAILALMGSELKEQLNFIKLLES